MKVDILRAAGMVQGMHHALSAIRDWNTLDRDGVLRCLNDIVALLDRHDGPRTVSRNLIEAQEQR